MCIEIMKKNGSSDQCSASFGITVTPDHVDLCESLSQKAGEVCLAVSMRENRRRGYQLYQQISADKGVIKSPKMLYRFLTTFPGFLLWRGFNIARLISSVYCLLNVNLSPYLLGRENSV